MLCKHRNQTDYILCSQRWRSSIQSAKTRPGVDHGSDHELLIAKLGLTLKKVGKTTRPFRYDLNRNPYDYTVEVTNRFKGLDLIDRVPVELWTEVRYIVQEPPYQTLKSVPCWLVNGCCSSFPSLPSPLVTTLLYQCKGSPLAH